MGRSVSTPTRRVVALSARDQKPKATPGLFANAALPLESALMLLPGGVSFTSTQLSAWAGDATPSAMMLAETVKPARPILRRKRDSFLVLVFMISSPKYRSGVSADGELLAGACFCTALQSGVLSFDCFGDCFSAEIYGRHKKTGPECCHPDPAPSLRREGNLFRTPRLRPHGPRCFCRRRRKHRL